jgi:hypothetical protein
MKNLGARVAFAVLGIEACLSGLLVSSPAHAQPYGEPPPPPPYYGEPPPYYGEPPPPPPARNPWSERLQLGAQVGYLFGADVDTTGGTVGIPGGAAYTFFLSVPWRYGVVFEGMYTWFPTRLDQHDFFGNTFKLTDLDVHFFQIGVEKELVPGAVRPFLGFLLGGTLFDPHSGFDSEFRFSTTFDVGLKAFPTERFGLRADFRVRTTWEDSGSSVFCSFGGCSFGVFGSGLTQVEFAGGAFFAF